MNYKLFLAYKKHLIEDIVNQPVSICITISIWSLKEKTPYVSYDNQLQQFMENSIIEIQSQVYTLNSLTDPTLPLNIEQLKNFLFTRKLLQDYYCKH